MPANDVRDGVSLSQTEKRKPIVTPEDLTSLRNLEAYVSLPEYAYVTKLKMKYYSPKVITEPFVERVNV